MLYDINLDDYIMKMEGILNQLQNKEIPESYPKEIGSLGTMMAFSKNEKIFRENFILVSSYPLISKDWIRELIPLLKNKRCLEIMAGSGMLSKALSEEGIDIIATDSKEWDIDDSWFDVEKLDAIEAINKYGKDIDYVICSWIPYQSTIGTKVIETMRQVNPNLKMIYIGELGGCCAEETFCYTVELLENEFISEANQKFKRWAGLRDKIYLLK